jgi:hypothetical protein
MEMVKLKNSKIAKPSSIPDPPFPILQHPVSSIQYPVSSIQHPASSIQHPASSIQHPASSIDICHRAKITFHHFHLTPGPSPGMRGWITSISLLLSGEGTEG